MIRIKNLNNTAFSLLEILLASIIFIISITGVFVTLTAVRKPVADKESSLAASVFGKQVLEGLRSSVNAGTYYGPCVSWNAAASVCGDFSLYLGNHQVPKANLLSGISWPPALTAWNTICDTAANGCLIYTVSCATGVQTGSPPDCNNGSSNDIARRVTLTINWPEAP